MLYNLVHRGAVIKTFDSDALDYDELRELKALHGEHFRVERATRETLPPLPDNYSMIEQVEQDRQRFPAGWLRTGYRQQPSA
jgi:hypothetical protein